jgi:hypothetical protein
MKIKGRYMIRWDLQEMSKLKEEEILLLDLAIFSEVVVLVSRDHLMNQSLVILRVFSTWVKEERNICVVKMSTSTWKFLLWIV